jgi:hypothetical protein
MRYRQLTSSGDYQFGHSGGDFWFNVPEAVGQAVKTRLLLFRGEWFADTSEGTPWGGFPLNDLVVAQGQILGKNTLITADVAIKTAVLQTQGVIGIRDYFSSFDPNKRSLSVGMVIDTIYGGRVQVGPITMVGFELDVTPIGGGPL